MFSSVAHLFENNSFANDVLKSMSLNFRERKESFFGNAHILEIYGDHFCGALLYNENFWKALMETGPFKLS